MTDWSERSNAVTPEERGQSPRRLDYVQTETETLSEPASEAYSIANDAFLHDCARHSAEAMHTAALLLSACRALDASIGTWW